MTQANQKGVIWTTIICSVVLLTALIWGLTSISVPEVVVPTEGAIISGVLAGIVVPAVPIMDTITTDRICELTDGCEYWEPKDDHDGELKIDNAVLLELNKLRARQDFKNAFEDLIGLDLTDEFTFVDTLNSFYEDETQIRAYSDNDADDDNWEVKTLLRVVYHDVDEDLGDNEVVYVVVTSVLDEGEYDELSIEEVSRDFEF